VVDQSNRPVQSRGDKWHNRRLGDLERLRLCVWGVLLGAAQILDAAKDYIPQIKHRRSASEFVGVIESVIIDARFEWFSIFTGEYQANEIMDRWRKLAKLLNETEGKYFPDGIPANPARQRLAEAEASAYFLNNYGVGGTENG
jgi:hypothetical protein